MASQSLSLSSQYTSIDDEAPTKSRKRMFLGIIFAVAAFSAVSSRSSFQVTNKTILTETEGETLQVINEFETRTGRVLNDGLLENLVRVHSPTTLSLKSGNPVIFHVETSPGSNEFTQINQEVASTVDHVFTEIGKHNVKASVTASDGTTSTLIYTITAKVIRIELRDLTEEDRKIYFDALQKFQFTSERDGVATYGKKYHSLEYIVRMHLYGAADKECDHWHDDAGFLNHHVAITWQFEQSLRKIDPRTAAHYWDYTREGARGIDWYDSDVFNDEWFGDNSPNNDEHILTTGRFAYSPVWKATDYSSIVNPYGLLRSPWNTNPNAFVMRCNKTFGHFADGKSDFPSCSKFSSVLDTDLIGAIDLLNGALHGPIHIMIGGVWGSVNDWSSVGLKKSPFDGFLLLSKWLWRQGFVRTPDSCSDDTAHDDCLPTCPEGILGSTVDDMSDKEAYDLLEETGVISLNPITNFATFMKKSGLGWKDLLKELCHVGSPGEMFSSAAPQDPTFWPLHGNVERVIQYARVLKKRGEITFDETWGYLHSPDLPSNTGMICDWSDVSGTLDMPTCTKGVCSGHKEDDLLPFEDLLESQGSTLYTNAEFYSLIDPLSEELPYAFDTFSYWEGCTDHNLLIEADSDVVELTSWEKLFGKSWGVM